MIVKLEICFWTTLLLGILLFFKTKHLNKFFLINVVQEWNGTMKLG